MEQEGNHACDRVTALSQLSSTDSFRGTNSRIAFSPRTHAHPNCALRPEADARFRFHSSGIEQLELALLQDRSEDQWSLHHDQRGTDALPRPGAKREVGELGSGGGALGQESVGIESVRIFPESWRAMGNIGRHYQECASGN